MDFGLIGRVFQFEVVQMFRVGFNALFSWVNIDYGFL